MDLSVADFFDLIIVLTLIFFTLRGASNGFISEIAGIAALLGGFWAARSWNAQLAPHLGFISDPALRTVTACVLIFIIVMLLIGLTARIIKKALAFSFVTWVDRVAGALLGLAKGIIIWALIFIILEKIVGEAQFLKDMRTVPFFNALIDHIREWLPPELASHI